MGVVGHGYGGFCGAGMEVVVGMHVGQRLEGGRTSGDTGACSECEVSH